jgi:hypothetical protein
MEYKRLGRSGLTVSRIIVGCMGFGDPSRRTHAWALGIDKCIASKESAKIGHPKRLVSASFVDVAVRSQARS